jgi:hypothetical protein
MSPLTFRSVSALALIAAAATAPAATPRVTDARVTPSSVREGQAVNLRLGVADPGSVRVVIELRRGGRLVRVWAKPFAVPGKRLVVALPRTLRAGRYRVSTVAIDAQGAWSRPLNRPLRVLPRR